MTVPVLCCQISDLKHLLPKLLLCQRAETALLSVTELSIRQIMLKPIRWNKELPQAEATSICFHVPRYKMCKAHELQKQSMKQEVEIIDKKKCCVFRTWLGFPTHGSSLRKRCPLKFLKFVMNIFSGREDNAKEGECTSK